MAELVLVGSEPLPLAPPTPEEVRIIEEFTHKGKELMALRRHIAKWAARSVNDVRVTPKAAKKIFDALNIKIESKIRQPFFTNSSLFSRNMQPRILSRSIGQIPSLDRFLCMVFGIRDINQALRERVQSKNHNFEFQEFFFDAFLMENEIAIRSELCPTVNDVVDLCKMGLFDDEFTRMALDSPNYTFIDLSFFPNQVVADLTEKCVEEILEITKDDDIDENLNFSQDSDLQNKWRFASVRRTTFVEKYRELISVELGDFVNEFRLGWNKREFFEFPKIDYQGESGVNSTLEDKIFNLLTLDKLDDSKTDSVNSSYSAQFGLQATSGTSYTDSISERLEIINQFAAVNPGKPVSGKILELFPELAKASEIPRVTVPEVAPAIWPNDRIEINGVLETPPDFIKRNYAEWLGKGITRADVRRLDKPLSTALDNWLRRNPMPDDLDLPTLKEQNLRWIERIDRGGLAGDGTEALLKHGQRLLSAKRRHERGAT
jgi:hypothetical protein